MTDNMSTRCRCDHENPAPQAGFPRSVDETRSVAQRTARRGEAVHPIMLLTIPRMLTEGPAPVPPTSIRGTISSTTGDILLSIVTDPDKDAVVVRLDPASIAQLADDLRTLALVARLLAPVIEL